MLALTVCDIFIFETFYLENLVQGDVVEKRDLLTPLDNEYQPMYEGPDQGVQHLQWSHSMANIHLYKSYTLALHFDIIL